VAHVLWIYFIGRILKNLKLFWQKDIINKLIILVSFLLMAGVVGLVLVIFNLRSGNPLQGSVSQFFISSTPTIDMDAVFTSMALTAIVEETPAYLRGAATITPASPHPTSSPVVTALLATETSGVEFTPTTTISSIDLSGINCIPYGEAQVGRVLDIMDGITVKVMLDGLVYNVRYIGLQLPDDAGFADAASMLNGQLVWGRDVNLYRGSIEKDELGQLLRYVVIDEKMVNLELINKGLVSVVDDPSGVACIHAFRDAEQLARSAKVGQWYK